MRRFDRDALEAREAEAALLCCCAACHAVPDEQCVDGDGRPRKPHKVRIRIGRWASTARSKAGT